jgi:hypothetical protein
MNMEEVDEFLDYFQEKHFPDWHGSKKRPYFAATDEPISLMTYTEPTGDYTRSWSHLRRCALAAPTGYNGSDHHETKPLINWSSHYFKPEQWEDLKDMYEEENYVVNMSLVARNSMLTDFFDYLENDDETIIVNPASIMDTFDNKLTTAKHLDQADLPGIPSAVASELIYDGKEAVEAQIGDGGDHGYVVKPFNGYGGDGVEGFDDIEGARDYITQELDKPLKDIVDNPPRSKKDIPFHELHLIQPKVPHNSDLRVITVGDDIVNAERRSAANGNLCTNISNIDGLVDGKDLGVYGNALNALKSGRVMPINVDYGDNISESIYSDVAANNPGLLPPGARDLSMDIINSFGPKEFNYNSDLPEKPFKIGIDLLETKKEDITHLPDSTIERALEYEDDGKVYLSPELNGNPGSMADLIARWSGLEDQVSTIHVNNLMRDLAGLETDEIDDITGNQNNSVWRRIDEWYPELQSESRFLGVAGNNLKPENRQNI